MLHQKKKVGKKFEKDNVAFGLIKYILLIFQSITKVA